MFFALSRLVGKCLKFVIISFRFTDDLTAGIKKALAKYAEYNDNVYPERVILFRDGVPGGTMHALQREAEDIKTGIESHFMNDLKGILSFSFQLCF